MNKTAERLTCAVLAAVLASYMCMPLPALAENGSAAGSQGSSNDSMYEPVTIELGDVGSSGSMSASGAYVDGAKLLSQATQGDTVDLNAAWKAQEEGLAAAYTITDGGTYYLSGDLSATNGLVIDAEGADVVLLLNGHTMTLLGTGSSARQTMLSVTAAKSVTIDGTSAKGTSKIASAHDKDKPDVRAVGSTAKDCALSLKNVTVDLSSEGAGQRTLSVHAVCAESGALLLDGCTVVMDMSNQKLKTVSMLTEGKKTEVPSAVYATADVKSVVLNDCAVTSKGPQGFALEDVSDTSTIGNAYALYSLAEKTQVKGGSFLAESMRGNATCLYGKSLEVLPADKKKTDQDATVVPVKLEADAGQLATGILSTEAGGVVLDAPIEFKVGGDYVGYSED